MRESISLTMLDKIVERYPEVNPVWVLLGEGKMFKEAKVENSGETVTMDREVWEEIQKMTETVNSQQRTIAVQAESIRHQTDSLFLLLKDAQIEGLTVAKLSPNEHENEQ